jgi:hypothetical protein
LTTLASVDWGGPSRRLLESTKELEPGKPAVMHIRHTARTTIFDEEHERGSKWFDSQTFRSTPTGIQAAVEFGSFLPSDRNYTIYHTYIERTRETAEAVSQGIIGAGCKVRVAGDVAYSWVVDVEGNNRWLRSQKPQDGAYSTTCLWIAGLVPETIRTSSWVFAKEYARVTMMNLRRASSDVFHIYVSHDTLVAALIFHWFGLPPYGDGIRFLEGFLMQVRGDGLHVWLRDRSMVYNLPYWWPKQE